MVNASTPAAASAVASAAAGALGVETVPVKRAARKAAAGPPEHALALADALGHLARASPSLVRGRRTRAAVAGYAPTPAATSRAAKSSTSSAKSSSTAKSSSSSLSFLSDPKLSIEEKLMRLLAYLNAKYEKEMQAKMDEIAGKAPKTASGSTSSTKKKDGILGAIGSAVGSAIGGDAAKAISGFLKLPGVKSVLGQITGPVLAAAASTLGFGAAAPLLLKYGSKVVDVAASVMGEAARSGGSSATSAGGTTASGADGKSEQLSMMEIQRVMDRQKEMFSLVSNILKSAHDTRMAAINNVR